MKRWIFSMRVEPPRCVVSARNGADVFFAAYSRALDQWYLCANGGEEKIDTPNMLFLDEDYARAHPSNKFDSNYSQIIPRRGKKHPQLELAL